MDIGQLKVRLAVQIDFINDSVMLRGNWEWLLVQSYALCLQKDLEINKLSLVN